jgi:hypothetical protein
MDLDIRRGAIVGGAESSINRSQLDYIRLLGNPNGLMPIQMRLAPFAVQACSSIVHQTMVVSSSMSLVHLGLNTHVWILGLR